MGESYQAQATIYVRLQMNYRNLNKVQEEDSKWEQTIFGEG